MSGFDQTTRMFTRYSSILLVVCSSMTNRDRLLVA
jgi:hypothetical protein